MTEQAASSADGSLAEPLCARARELAAAPGADTDERHAELVSLLRRARASDEDKPATLVALADCRLADGRVVEAEELYRRAAERGAPCAHIYLGWFLRDRLEDVAGAEEALRRAHEVGEPGAPLHLGRFLYDH